MAACEPEQFSTDVNLDPEDLKDLQNEEEEGTRGAAKFIVSNATEHTICLKIAEIATTRQDVPLLGKGLTLKAGVKASVEGGGGNVEVKTGDTTFTKGKLEEMVETVAAHDSVDIPLPGKCGMSILRPETAGQINNAMTMRVYNESTMEEIGKGYIFGVGHVFIIREGPGGKLAVYEGRKRSFMKRVFLSEDRWLPKSKNMATQDPHQTLKSREKCPTCLMTKA